MNIIDQIEKEQMAAVLTKRRIPDFSPGDTLKVMVRVAEEAEPAAKGKAKAKKDVPKVAFRLQAYEGVCIARDGGGINESFTVRKISYGEGVERVFPLYSPFIGDIEVVRRGRVRRAKLYFLRDRRGKSARILERTDARAKRLASAFKGFKRPKGTPDDLTKINGIDKDMETQLKKLNVLRFDQMSEFSGEDIANIDDLLNLDGRLEREDWMGQARGLLTEAEAAAPAEAAKS